MISTVACRARQGFELWYITAAEVQLRVKVEATGQQLTERQRKARLKADAASLKVWCPSIWTIQGPISAQIYLALEWCGPSHMTLRPRPPNRDPQTSGFSPAAL